MLVKLKSWNISIITKELNEAFITPIDREDIYSLIKMDDVLD